MKGKKQRSFSSEFKIEVVKEYLETDRSYRELGRKYGLSPSAICNWVKECFWQLVNTVLGQIKIQNPGLTV